MKTFLITLVLALSLTSAIAGPPSDEEVEKARRECNATNPVQQDPVATMLISIIDGKMLNLSGVEKCFLTCLYHTLNLYDENSKIDIELLKDWTSLDPESRREMYIATGKTLNMATRNYENKCERGFVNSYHILFEEIVQDEVEPSRKIAGREKQINDAIENGKPIVTLLQSKVKHGFFGHTSERIAQRKISHVEFPLQHQARKI